MIPMNSRNPLTNVVRTDFQSSEDDSEYLRTSRRDAPSLSTLTFSHSLGRFLPVKKGCYRPRLCENALNTSKVENYGRWKA